VENVYTVKIAGVEISLYSSETKEYTDMVAKEVDSQIHELMGDNLSVSVTTAAILSAMSFYDEIIKLRTGADNMRIQIKSYLDDTTKAIAERDEARRMVEKLKDELLSLKIDISNNKKN
jgi:cell division protein ZapA (FtsZ GTPase activity inhibitor)